MLRLLKRSKSGFAVVLWVRIFDFMGEFANSFLRGYQESCFGWMVSKVAVAKRV